MERQENRECCISHMCQRQSKHSDEKPANGTTWKTSDITEWKIALPASVTYKCYKHFGWMNPLMEKMTDTTSGFSGKPSRHCNSLLPQWIQQLSQLAKWKLRLLHFVKQNWNCLSPSIYTSPHSLAVVWTFLNIYVTLLVHPREEI